MAERSAFVLTGHASLGGGALAVLAAALLHFRDRQRIAGVFTYGQPRLGDPAFSTAFDQALGAVTFRYVNDLDVVPHVPPTRLAARPVLSAPPAVFDLLRKAKELPHEIHTAINTVIEGERFSHVGQLRLFQRDGFMSSDEQEWQKREVIYSGTFSELLNISPTCCAPSSANCCARKIGSSITTRSTATCRSSKRACTEFAAPDSACPAEENA